MLGGVSKESFFSTSKDGEEDKGKPDNPGGGFEDETPDPSV